MPPEATSAIFGICIPTIFVRDVDGAVRFYTEVMGFRRTTQQGQNVNLAGPGLTIAIRPRGGPAPIESSRVHFGFTVRDLDEAMRALSAKGISFVGDIVETDAARVAFFEDPEGTSLYIVQWK